MKLSTSQTANIINIRINMQEILKKNYSKCPNLGVRMLSGADLLALLYGLLECEVLMNSELGASTSRPYPLPRMTSGAI